MKRLLLAIYALPTLTFLLLLFGGSPSLKIALVLFVYFPAIVFLNILLAWAIYNAQSSAQPDNPDDENYPIVRGPQDAWSQRIIDDGTRPKDTKKD